MARSVELEIVSYRMDDIAETAASLVYNFTRYSEIAGIDAWYLYLKRLIDRIMNQVPQGYRLTAPGIDLWFSGFDLSPHEKEGKLTFEEPWFRALSNRQLVLPSQRTHIDRVTSAIFGEVGEVYHLDRQEPYVLGFPKQIYVKEVKVFNAALL